MGGAKKAGAISRWKSDPGKAEQAAWKQVLPEAAATPNPYTAVAWGV